MAAPASIAKATVYRVFTVFFPDLCLIIPQLNTSVCDVSSASARGLWNAMKISFAHRRHQAAKLCNGDFGTSPFWGLL
jgi:hypothetical protein